MTNRQISRMLFTIATILDQAQDTVFRVRAYRRAARRILALREPAVTIVARGEDLPLPGVGVRIRRKLAELIATGQLGFYDELIDDQPPELRTLLRIDGIGPALAARLYGQLGITTPEGILAAAHAGRLRSVFGIGARQEANLAGAAARAADMQRHVA